MSSVTWLLIHIFYCATDTALGDYSPCSLLYDKEVDYGAVLGTEASWNIGWFKIRFHSMWLLFSSKQGWQGGRVGQGRTRILFGILAFALNQVTCFLENLIHGAQELQMRNSASENAG